MVDVNYQHLVISKASSRLLLCLVSLRLMIDFASETVFIVDLILILVGVFLGYKFISYQVSADKIQTRTIHFSLITFISIVYVAISISISLTSSSSGLYESVKYFFVLVVFLQLTWFVKRLPRHEVFFIRRILINLMTLNASICVIEYISDTKIFVGRVGLTSSVPDDRFSGFIIWPNTASALFCMTIMFLLLSKERSLEIYIKILILIAGAISTGVLTGPIALLLVFTFSLLQRRNLSSLIFVSLFTYFAYVLLYRDSTFIDRIQNFRIPNLESISSAPELNSLTWRVWNWSEAYSTLGSQKFFGLGLGRTSDIARFGGYLPHNDYLRILIETGFIGLILFILNLVKGFKNSFKGASSIGTTSKYIVFFILITMLVSNIIGQAIFALFLPFFVLSGSNHEKK